ncbi:MAG: oxidoreductase [Alphaproteobacteria bacterium]|nr:oxidoreductase [Alphaproteobacteria bacterium]
MLKNKTIIVTGSSSGIGLAIAKHCVELGANVVLHGTRENLLQQACETLGPQSTYLAADLAKPETAQQLVDHALKHFDRLDGIVNNAGVFPRSNIAQVDADSFDWVFAVNTRAPMLLAQAAVKVFRDQKTAGSIVNIGSINAYCGQTDLLIYSMSKGALMTMTRNLGDSLSAENIRVNQLNVGWTLTETEHQTQLKEGQPEDWLDKVPQAFAPTGTILRPEQIAPHAAFWLSDQSIPVTGQVYELEQYPMIGRSKIAER